MKKICIGIVIMLCLFTIAIGGVLKYKENKDSNTPNYIVTIYDDSGAVDKIYYCKSYIKTNRSISVYMNDGSVIHSENEYMIEEIMHIKDEKENGIF